MSWCSNCENKGVREVLLLQKMPPKQRHKAQSSKDQPAAKETSDEHSRSSRAMNEELSRRQKARKKEVKWSPVFKRIGYFSLVFIIPAILNYAALNQERNALMPQGAQLYDVGWGQKLLLQCMGNGLPTVVLDAPIGQNSGIWTLIQPIIAEHTKVCVYDRAGLGFSDRAYVNTSEYTNDFGDAAKDRDKTQPSTVERMVDDLHRLLTYASNQPKPFLFVSSDFTTFVSRFYTQIYEQEVAGLFLLDPAIESLLDKPLPGEEEESSTNKEEEKDPTSSWPEYWSTLILPRMQQVWLSSVVGFNRIALMVGLTSPIEDMSILKKLPNQLVLRKKHFLCEPKHLSSAWYECYYMNESMSQMKTVFRVKPFPNDIPITIATFKEEDPHLAPALSEAWKAGMHKLIHTVHPNSKHVLLPGSDYLSLFRHPQTVAAAILTMVKDWRRHSRAAA